MTIESILKINTLEEWIKKFGWQGGTIHQVKEEIKKRLRKSGIIENYNTKELNKNLKIKK